MSHYLKYKIVKNIFSQVWWYMPIIPALGRLRQKDLSLKASLGYMGRPPHQTTTKENL
jgi:hypothetical protein